jgi:hypothetical protein
MLKVKKIFDKNKKKIKKIFNMSSTALLNDDAHCHYCSVIVLIFALVYFSKFSDCKDIDIPIISDNSETPRHQKERKTIFWLSIIGLVFWFLCPIIPPSSKTLKMFCTAGCYLITIIVSILSIHYVNRAKIGLCNPQHVILNGYIYGLLLAIISSIYLLMTAQKVTVKLFYK